MFRGHSLELYSRLRAKGLIMSFISFVLELIQDCEVTYLNILLTASFCYGIVFMLGCKELGVLRAFLDLPSKLYNL